MVLSDRGCHKMLLQNQGDRAAQPRVRMLIQRGDSRCVGSRTLLADYSLNYRSNSFPRSRYLARYDDQVRRKSRYQHCNPDTKIVCHSVNRLDCLGVTHSVKAQQVVNIRNRVS
jgi:hypothetical protein